MSQPYLAEIKIVGFSFAPRGYAFCDGQLLPISQNSALYALIGTTYGGDGVNTFGLPNLQGRAPLHWGNGAGLTPRVLGEILGTEEVTLTTATMPAHTHTLSGDATGGGLTSPTNNTWGKKAARTPPALYQSTPVDAPMSANALGTAGGNLPHNNLSPVTVLNFVMAIEGIFPSRN